MSRVLLAGLVAALFAPLAHAAPIQPFTDQAFHDAQAKGRPVLIDAHADWCPVCRAQAPTIAAISKDPAYDKLLILMLDYDKQAAEKHELGVRQQSTLIAFKGAKETGRAVGVTDVAQIKALAGGPLH